jgi:hypothetical protein
MPAQRWKKVNTWRIKGPFLVVAFLLGLFDHVLHWGGISLAAAIAIVVPIIGFRDHWNAWRFWVTVAAMAVLQLPLVLALRPMLGKSAFPFLYGFGLLDCAFVIASISYVCGDTANEARPGHPNHN